LNLEHFFFEFGAFFFPMDAFKFRGQTLQKLNFLLKILKQNLDRTKLWEANQAINKNKFCK